jgi:hypothetical protein
VKVWLLLSSLLLSVPGPASVETQPTAHEVLAAWDAERSAAWAAGDVPRLEALYTDGSVAGERDAAMLEQWVDRGRVVTGLRMQVLSLREVSRTTDRWVLAVVDRVVGAESDGDPLPVDEPSAHTLVLRRVGGEWLVASVLG